MPAGRGSSIFSLFAALLGCAIGGTFEAIAATSPKAPVAAMTFSPGGTNLIVGRRLSIDIHGVATRQRERVLDCAFTKVSSLTFSPDGHTLFVAGGSPGVSGGVQVFDWPGGQPVQTLTNRADMATALAMSPSGESVAVAGADHEVVLFRFDPAKRQLTRLQQLKDHSRPVLAAVFSPDGKYLVTTSADRSIKVWDAQAGSLLRSFSHHTDIVHCLAVRPKAAGEMGPFACASGSDDRTVRVWQPEIGRMVRIIRRHEGAVFALAFSRDGTRLFSAGKEGVIRMIDGDSDEIQQQWPAHTDWIYSLAISPDGNTLASGDWAGNVKLWSVQAPVGRLLGVLE